MALLTERSSGRVSSDACHTRHQRIARRADLSRWFSGHDHRAWRAGRFELVTSMEQLDELRRVSRYPELRPVLPAHRIWIGTMVNNMQRAIIIETLPNLPVGIEANYPNDSFLLAMTLASDAAYLTGDRRAGLLQRGRVVALVS